MIASTKEIPYFYRIGVGDVEPSKGGEECLREAKLSRLAKFQNRIWGVAEPLYKGSLCDQTTLWPVNTISNLAFFVL